MSTLEAERLAPAPLAPTATGPGRFAWARRWWVVLALLLGLFVMIGPFVWMVLASLKTQRELLQLPPTWLPENPTTANYERL